MAKIAVSWTLLERHSTTLDIPDDKLSKYLDEDGDLDWLELSDLLPEVEGNDTYDHTEDRQIEDADVA